MSIALSGDLGLQEVAPYRADGVDMLAELSWTGASDNELVVRLAGAIVAVEDASRHDCSGVGAAEGRMGLL